MKIYILKSKIKIALDAPSPLQLNRGAIWGNIPVLFASGGA